MRDRFLRFTTIILAASAAGTPGLLSIGGTSAQSPAQSPKTAWGEPDLQGIWTDETDTPLQRSPKFANQEFFTDAERADLDRQRSALMGRDKRSEREIGRA